MIDRSRARPDHTDPDRGAVTVETAVIMPACSAVTVSNGRLAVNGSIASNVTLGPGGTLGGTGTVFGTVSGNGILAPGKCGIDI